MPFQREIVHFEIQNFTLTTSISMTLMSLMCALALNFSLNFSLACGGLIGMSYSSQINGSCLYQAL